MSKILLFSLLEQDFHIQISSNLGLTVFLIFHHFYKKKKMSIRPILMKYEFSSHSDASLALAQKCLFTLHINTNLNSYLNRINLIIYISLIQINHDNKYYLSSFIQSCLSKTVRIAWSLSPSLSHAYDTSVRNNTKLANRGYVSHDTTDRQKSRFVFSQSDVSCRLQMHGEESICVTM